MVPLEHYLFNNIFTENIGLNIFLIIVFIVLIFFAAFFSKTSAAISSANTLRLKSLIDEDKNNSKKASYFIENIDFVLMTIIICSTISKVLLVLIGSYFMLLSIDNILIALGVSFIVMNAIIVLLIDIIPKMLIKDAEKYIIKNSPLIYFLTKISLPLTFLFRKTRETISSKYDNTTSPYVTEEQLESIIDTMENEGVIDEEDADLIQSAIGLNERVVYDIMTPRVDVIAIEDTMEIEEIREIFFEHQFSRIPVFHEDKDKIVGILSEKDFFTALIKGEEFKVLDLISKPLYVSESTKVYDLIKELQNAKKHIAIVADEYGGTSGIVTMEDALEELVGEIYDEYDEIEEDNLIKLSVNKYQVSTEMDIEELFDALNLGGTPKSQFTSVGGFVYGLCDGLPYEGGVVNYKSSYPSEDGNSEVQYELTFVINKVVNRRIRAIELTVNIMNDEQKEE